MFKVAAFIDDVRDGTDNRPVRSDVWLAADKALHDVDALHCRWWALPAAA